MGASLFALAKSIYYEINGYKRVKSDEPLADISHFFRCLIRLKS